MILGPILYRPEEPPDFKEQSQVVPGSLSEFLTYRNSERLINDFYYFKLLNVNVTRDGYNKI